MPKSYFLPKNEPGKRKWLKNFSSKLSTYAPTVGVTPVIRELAGSDLKIKLAVSIVAADEELRAKLVPMEAKYPLREIIPAVRNYCLARMENQNRRW